MKCTVLHITWLLRTVFIKHFFSVWVTWSRVRRPLFGYWSWRILCHVMSVVLHFKSNLVLHLNVFRGMYIRPIFISCWALATSVLSATLWVCLPWISFHVHTFFIFIFFSHFSFFFLFILSYYYLMCVFVNRPMIHNMSHDLKTRLSLQIFDLNVCNAIKRNVLTMYCTMQILYFPSYC